MVETSSRSPSRENFDALAEQAPGYVSDCSDFG